MAALIGTLGGCTTPGEDGADNAWSLTSPDASGGDAVLAVEDGAQWTDEGLAVNGTGYATTETPGPIATDASFTVTAWARPTGRLGEYAVVLSQAGDLAGAFFLGVAEGMWSFSVKPEDGNGDAFVTNRDRATQVEVQPDAWVHLTGVYDSEAGRATFFLNGYPVSEHGVATDPVYAAQGPLLFGRAQAHGQPSDFFTGMITDVRTWPRALSADEVSAVAQDDVPEGASLDQPDQSAASVCPNPHGGLCRGVLDAGTYSTTAFAPALSYTVPRGWQNGEDLPGNVLLSRPEDQGAGIWGGSYIGIYQNIRAAAPCGEVAQPGVGTSADELAEWYRNTPGLQVMDDTPVITGGLSGVALDLTVDDQWRSECPLAGSIHAVPILIGGGVSDLHHVLGAPLQMRLYLLDWNGGNVAIEVTAVLDQHDLSTYLNHTGAGPIVDSFAFAP
ncbi:LamG domain-containing protein [Arthrobacter sp. B0490]|uniref:LamG domain-containing protein n=1 Tax=Arthrobacter sp. B0490 TaxID=2058891 RepID=UPI0015E45F26|nr:LamG domain-containing protein [Arthrobacter sp. B0490]